MRSETRSAVDDWWRSVFGLAGDRHDELWSSVTVLHPHVQLGDYEGWYVAWREAGVHVSAPAHADPEELSSLLDRPVVSMQSAEFWHRFAARLGLDVIGPGVHRFLDEDPGPAAAVREVAPDELRVLFERVDPPDLWESGLDEAVDEPGVVAFAAGGGGAVLRQVAGAPRNVALLVVPETRGRGVGTALGRAAASYAVQHHGWCRWRSRDTNVASTRVAERLGFEPYATQLALRAVRRGSSGA